MRSPTRRQLADHCCRFMPVPESQICSHSRWVKSAPVRRMARRSAADRLASPSRPSGRERSRRKSAGLPGLSGSRREAGKRSVDSPGSMRLALRSRRLSGSRPRRPARKPRPLRLPSSSRSIIMGLPPASPDSPGLAGKPRPMDGLLASGERPVVRPGLIPEAGPVEGDPPGELVWAFAAPTPNATERHARAIVVVRIALLIAWYSSRNASTVRVFLRQSIRKRRGLLS